MGYLELLVVVFKSIWSLKNLRLALIFKGQDFAQSEGPTPILTDEEAWDALDAKEKDLLINTKYAVPPTEAKLRDQLDKLGLSTKRERKLIKDKKFISFQKLALTKDERNILRNQSHIRYTEIARKEVIYKATLPKFKLSEAEIKEYELLNDKLTEIFKNKGSIQFDAPTEVSLKESSWDTWSLEEKVFYLELKKSNAIDASGVPVGEEVRTQSEEFLEYIKELKLGWATPVINFLFSPTFTRVVALIAAVAMIFTPLGPGVGAVAMLVGITSVAVDIYRYTAKYRELTSAKEENVLLTEIKKESAELEATLGQSTEAFRKIIATTMPGHNINPNTKAPSLLKASGYTIIGAYSNLTVGIILSFITLNPIPLLISVLAMITGYMVTTSMYYQFDKRFTYLNNANAVMKAELGLEQDFESGGRNMYLSNHLNMMRCYNLAVAEVAKDPEAMKINPDRDLLRQKLVEAFNREVELAGKAEKCPRPSFAADTWTLIKDGVNWVGVNRRFTPSFMEADVAKHHSIETFTAKREAGLKTMAKARETFKEVLTDIAKPQPEKKAEPLAKPSKGEEAAQVIKPIEDKHVHKHVTKAHAKSLIGKEPASNADRVLASKRASITNTRD